MNHAVAGSHLLNYIRRGPCVAVQKWGSVGNRVLNHTVWLAGRPSVVSVSTHCGCDSDADGKI